MTISCPQYLPIMEQKAWFYFAILLLLKKYIYVWNFVIKFACRLKFGCILRENKV